MFACIGVALRKESVDRNLCSIGKYGSQAGSLSARRAWIEMLNPNHPAKLVKVALRKESVDRNDNGNAVAVSDLESLSARRAWIEIVAGTRYDRPPLVALRKESVDRNGFMAKLLSIECSRSPQGERG